MKKPTKTPYSKRAIIKSLGLKRVARVRDGHRVWLDTQGNEYESIAEAAKLIMATKKAVPNETN